jgi:hypothetical protein
MRLSHLLFHHILAKKYLHLKQNNDKCYLKYAVKSLHQNRKPEFIYLNHNIEESDQQLSKLININFYLGLYCGEIMGLKDRHLMQ